MARDDTLDLGRIDPPIWRILVADVVYGPYTIGQMQSFLHENRLSPQSVVAMGDGGAFKPAAEQAGLAKLFREFEKKKPTSETDIEVEPSNYVIIHKGPKEARHAVVEALNGIGMFVEAMDGVFLINTDLRTTDVRDRILAECDEADRVLIVNTDQSRLAWHGIGHDISTHIHKVWKSR